jgi:bifunctional non-homologous end joining protein LigD
VTAVNRQASVAIGLLDGSNVVPVGNVTLKPNQGTVTAGDIVEVKYLYMRSAGGALYQPELLAIRTDVDRDECTIDQIKLRG